MIEKGKKKEKKKRNVTDFKKDNSLCISKNLKSDITFIKTNNNEIHYFGIKQDIEKINNNNNNNNKKEKNLKLEKFSDEIIDIVSGGAHSIFLTKDNNVYSKGSNKNGQLGLKNTVKGVNVPTMLLFFKDIKILSVSAGINFNFAIDEYNNVFSWGNNEFGQLAFDPEQNQMISIPTQVDTLSNLDIKEIQCSYGFAVAKTFDNQLIAWGLNDKGQLGTKSNCKSEWYPALLDIKSFRDESIQEYSVGYDHVICITELGDLYGFGSNQFGQLAQDPNRLGYQPFFTSPRLLIDSKSKISITTVATGLHYTICITDRGEMIVCGSNKYGCLGIDKKYNKIFKFVKHPNFSHSSKKKPFPCIQILAALHHVVCKLGDDSIYAWGVNNNNNKEDKQQIIYTPIQIDLDVDELF
eukprot:TRINITY_DN1959_c0_g9_i1.p1 TRINITY_DN1959_c0_g9~~TRINITY_DN1959_c0_g9_i1.p1  ORF type:complete len:410 (+),score=116.35 TRINITY_DN1959_c0_g9_i1:1411-2640(+)